MRQGDTFAANSFEIVMNYIMCNTKKGKEEDLGFQLHRRRSRRHSAITVTDLDFVDKVALLTEEIEQSQEMINRLKLEAASVDLFYNANKTEI